MSEPEILQGRKPADWHLKPPFDFRILVLSALVVCGLGYSAQRLDLGRDGRAFSVEVAGDGFAQGRVGDEVGRVDG